MLAPQFLGPLTVVKKHANQLAFQFKVRSAFGVMQYNLHNISTKTLYFL